MEAERELRPKKSKGPERAEAVEEQKARESGRQGRETKVERVKA